LKFLKCFAGVSHVNDDDKHLEKLAQLFGASAKEKLGEKIFIILFVPKTCHVKLKYVNAFWLLTGVGINRK
jgi:hypothetical protein